MIRSRRGRVRRMHFDRWGLVYEVGTLSKVVAPALRIGFMIGPPGPLMDALVQHTCDVGFSAPLFCQEIASYLLDREGPRRLEEVRQVYRQRAEVARRAIERCLAWALEDLSGGQAGFYYYLTFREIETGEGSACLPLSHSHNRRLAGRWPLPSALQSSGYLFAGTVLRRPSRQTCAKKAGGSLRISYAYEELPQIERGIAANGRGRTICPEGGRKTLAGHSVAKTLLPARHSGGSFGPRFRGPLGVVIFVETLQHCRGISTQSRVRFPPGPLSRFPSRGTLPQCTRETSGGKGRPTELSAGSAKPRPYPAQKLLCFREPCWDGRTVLFASDSNLIDGRWFAKRRGRASILWGSNSTGIGSDLRGHSGAGLNRGDPRAPISVTCGIILAEVGLFLRSQPVNSARFCPPLKASAISFSGTLEPQHHVAGRCCCSLRVEQRYFLRQSAPTAFCSKGQKRKASTTRIAFPSLRLIFPAWNRPGELHELADDHQGHPQSQGSRCPAIASLDFDRPAWKSS